MLKPLKYTAIISCVSTLFVLIACESRSTLEMQFDRMKWMQGKWTMYGDGKSMTEHWQFQNDTSIKGDNYFVVDADTFQPELLSIKVIDSSIYYVATVSDQNDGASIPFLLTKNEEGLHLFVNPNHDFPNNILYENIGDSVMRATVSGHVAGEYREQVYRMVKQPD